MFVAAFVVIISCSSWIDNNPCKAIAEFIEHNKQAFGLVGGFRGEQK